MIKILRFLARLMIVLIAIPCSLCMGLFWLFVWTPLVLLGAAVLFLIDFANGEESDTNPLKPIMWVFWGYVMFNFKRAEKWL